MEVKQSEIEENVDAEEHLEAGFSKRAIERKAAIAKTELSNELREGRGHCGKRVCVFVLKKYERPLILPLTLVQPEGI